jgi:hypothetical protein
MLQLFHLDVLKVDRWCCVCCNVSHLSQQLAAAAETPGMEGSGVADVEGRRKQGSVGKWRGRAPTIRGASAGIHTKPKEPWA